MSHIDDLREEFNLLQQELANEEVLVTGKVFNRKLEEVKHKAVREIEKENNVVDQRFGKWINLALGYLATFSAYAIALFGTIAILILFPVTEYTAVHSGIVAFEDSKLVAVLTSVTVVIGYIVVTFLSFSFIESFDYIPKATLSNWWNGIRYFVTGKLEYLVEVKTNTKLYRIAQEAVFYAEMSIILFGFIGRIHHLAEENSDIAWFEFFGDLLYANTIVTFGIVGTIIAILTVLRVSKLALLFVHYVFTQNAGKLDLGKSLNLKALTEERILQYQIEMMQQVLAQKRAKNE